MSFSRAQAQRFNAQCEAHDLKQIPAVIVFTGESREWTVPFGPSEQSRQMPEHGQGFYYFRVGAMRFPVGERAVRLGETFCRKSDDTIPEDTWWRVEKLKRLPNRGVMRVEIERVERPPEA